MAFNSSLARQITTATLVRTASANGDVVIGFRATNTTASAIKVSAYVTRSATNYYLIGGATNSTMGADVPVGGSLIIVNGDIDKLVLNNGDTVYLVASGAADSIVSVLEG